MATEREWVQIEAGIHKAVSSPKRAAQLLIEVLKSSGGSGGDSGTALSDIEKRLMALEKSVAGLVSAAAEEEPKAAYPRVKIGGRKRLAPEDTEE